MSSLSAIESRSI